MVPDLSGSRRGKDFVIFLIMHFAKVHARPEGPADMEAIIAAHSLLEMKARGIWGTGDQLHAAPAHGVDVRQLQLEMLQAMRQEQTRTIAAR